jgi:hypothetical protein
MRRLEQIEIAFPVKRYSPGLRLRRVPGLAVTRSIPFERDGGLVFPDDDSAWTLTYLATGETLGVFFSTAVQAGRFALLMRARGVDWRTLDFEGLTVARRYRRAYNNAIRKGPPAIDWRGRRVEERHAA